MIEQDAQRKAEEQKRAYHVPAVWEAGQPELRWIELTDAGDRKAAPARDLRAWVVRFGDELQWIELAIDDGTGGVVRVERSR